MKRLAAVLCVFLLAGCGQDTIPEAETPAAPPEAPSVQTTTTAPTPTEPAPQRGLPAAVEETRNTIIEAAEARDYDALEDLVPDDGFTYSYGEPTEGGEVGYWRDLEAAGETPLATMAALLGLRHTRSRGIFVWPWAYDRDPAELTDEEKDAIAAAGAATRKQLDQMAELGHYLGWRLGIQRDGTWVFFVAGD